MPTRHVIAALAALALILPIASISPSPATSAPNVTFGSAVIVDPIHAYGEPDVRIRGNNWYVSGPWGTGTQRSIFEWSSDGGQTFRPLHSVPMTTVNDSATTILGPGGGDTEISIDHNDKVYYADLAALLTLKVATWDPHTRTMEADTLTNVGDTSNTYDRQWFALWDPPDPADVRKATGYTGPFPVNYLSWNGNGSTSSYSFDGINYPPSSMSVDVGGDGPLVIDQQTGTVFQPATIADDIDDIGVFLRWRDPAKPTEPALAKSRIIKIADTPKGTSAGALFPVIAIDQARTVYVVWCTQSGDTPSKNPDAWQIWYSYALASGGWTKWSKPVRLSAPPARTNVMPWAVAGSKGRLAAVWYGTDEAVADPGSGDVHQAWDVYLSVVTNADTPRPAIEQVKVTRHPMHYGTICFSGAGCIIEQGNRNLADFFEVDVDGEGAIVIVYNDTSNELIQSVPGTDTPIPPPIDGILDHRGIPVVVIAKQNGGIGLFGKPIVSQASFGAPRLAGKKGNATFDPVYGGEQIPALDAQGLSVAAEGSDLVFKIAVSSLDDTAGALTTTGAAALDYIVRWVGEPIDSPTGRRNPIYYAAAEVTLSGSPTFFAGIAQSVDLCSVSACSPSLITYPAPPLGGTSVSGKLVQGEDGATDHWEIRVPRGVVGGPRDDSLFESLSTFTIALNKPASLPMTNAEFELGLAPVLLDALCCIDATLAANAPKVDPSKVTHNPAPKPKPTVRGGPLAATGVKAVPLSLSLALIAGALFARRTLRKA